PPDGGVQVRKHHWVRRRVRDFVQTRAQDQDAVHRQQRADEEPDRDEAFSMHAEPTRKSHSVKRTKHPPPRPRKSAAAAAAGVQQADSWSARSPGPAAPPGAAAW